MTESARLFKDALYSQLARVGKAISAPTRIELLELLCQGPRTVEAIAGQVGISVANASQHLRILHAARLVEAEKRGLFVQYRVADERVFAFLHGTRELANARLVEIREITATYLKSRNALEQISGAELIRRVKEGRVTVLDVRPVEEYRAGHIPDSLSVPLGDLKGRLAELPKGRDIVAYCRGPYCVMAIAAVRILRNAGLNAFRMEHGVIEWRARGWRIDKIRTLASAQQGRV